MAATSAATEPPPKATGRPSIFSQETADTICARIASGESLRAICEGDDMPSISTVIRWLAEPARAAFQAQYTRAREVQADTLFDEVLSIADDARNDWMLRHGKDDAGWAENGDSVRRSALRVDARKWMAGKLRPKKYGDRVAHDVSVRVAANEMSDDDLARIATDRPALSAPPD